MIIKGKCKYMNNITEQQQLFIELSAQRVLDSSLTMDSIAEQVGVSRKTCYNWEKKFSKEIARYSSQNLSQLKTQLYKVTADMLTSTKANERIKGAELLLKLEDKEMLEAEASTRSREMDIVVNVTKTLIDVLDVKPEEMQTYAKLVFQAAHDSVVERPDKYNNYSHLTLSEMLESLTL